MDDATDIDELIEAVPLRSLALSTRPVNALRNAGLATVGDMLKADLPSINGIGKSSLKEIDDSLRRLRSMAEDGIRGEELDLRQPVCQVERLGSLLDAIPDIAEAVSNEDADDRGFQVLARHYGLMDDERFTLEDIGLFFDITRESKTVRRTRLGTTGNRAPRRRERSIIPSSNGISRVPLTRPERILRVTRFPTTPE